MTTLAPSPQFEPSGYFRVEKTDRWWMVTPEGNAHLTLGLNHVAPDFLLRDPNRDYWINKFNAKSVGDPNWQTGFQQKVANDLQAFGVDALGCHSPTHFYKKSFIPYVHSLYFVNNSHWQQPPDEEFMDVFSPEFVAHCDRVAQEHCAHRAEDAFLMGYMFTDCPIFTDLEAAGRGVRIYGAPRYATITWPRRLRNLGKNAPGKQMYIRLMRKQYSDSIHHFNQTYQTPFNNWDELAFAETWRPDVDLTLWTEIRDNNLFLREIVREYYRVTTNAIRKYDPNHLIFGDKLNLDTDTPDFIIKLASEYMGAIFYQSYSTWEQQRERLDHWSAITGKALLNGDGSYNIPDPEYMPNPFGPHFPNQEARAQAFLEDVRKLFTRPDFIGWHWCGWTDSWNNVPRQYLIQHAGIMDPFGKYDPHMQAAMNHVSKAMYTWAMEAL